MTPFEHALQTWRATQPPMPPDDAGDTVVDSAPHEETLRTHMTELTSRGWTDEEAFTAAVRKLATTDEATAEFARRHPELLWPAASTPVREPRASDVRPGSLWMAMLVGALTGLGMYFAMESEVVQIQRLVPLFILAILALFVGWAKRLPVLVAAWVLGPLAVLSLLVAFVVPTNSSDVAFLAVAYAAAFMLLVVAWVSSKYRLFTPDGGMEFLRTAGEALVLGIFVSGGVSALVTASWSLFSAIGVDVGWKALSVVLMVACGTGWFVVVWVAESKLIPSRVAPTLARILSPLMCAMLFAFLVAAVVQGSPTSGSRELLMLSAGVLILAYAMLVYLVSSRGDSPRLSVFDWIAMVLAGLAMLMAVYVLFAMFARAGDSGFTPNRTNALVLHSLLVANLGGTLWHYIRGARGAGFTPLVAGQTRFFAVWGVWALLVVVAFPLAFAR